VIAQFERLELDLVGTDGCVGRITIDRPDKGNSFAPETMRQLVGVPSTCLKRTTSPFGSSYFAARAGFSARHDLTQSYAVEHAALIGGASPLSPNCIGFEGRGSAGRTPGDAWWLASWSLMAPASKRPT
jgi:enoyl-CoA hydratase/carnithine racemase